MEALYAKLYNKYTKLKKEKESEFDKLNHDQEVKFLNFAAAADEMIQYLKSGAERLHEQVDELRTELASVRSSGDEQNTHYQKLWMEECQKNKELSEEIARLQRLEHNECSGGAVHGGDPVEQYNSNEGTQGAEAVKNLLQNYKHLYSDKGGDAPTNIHQPPCCKKEIYSSGGNAGTVSVNCVFQYLVGLLLGLEISPLAQSNELCILGHHQSSGYTFSLSWIANSAGQTELLYRVIALGTLERVAPEWMKEETIIFSPSMCNVFFERVSRVLKS